MWTTAFARRRASAWPTSCSTSTWPPWPPTCAPNRTPPCQLALVRHGPLSLILFAFDADGAIPEHRTEGEVVIHVLRGRLSVTVDGEELALHGGQLLALAPGQPHGVRALEAREMLLAICRDRGEP